MDDKKLITCIRDRRILYDLSDPYSSDAQRKINEWREIGEILQEEPRKCKTRWESLRNQFRKHIRLRKSGLATDHSKRWKYFKSMSFLIPYMRDKSFVPTENDGQVATPEEENIEADEELSFQGSSVTRNSTTVIPMVKLHTPEQNGHKTVESARAVLIKYLLEEENKDKAKEEQEKDDIDLFFETMKATVKKFSPANKLLAKQRVFSVIYELEGFDLNQQQADPLANNSSDPNFHQYSKPTHSQPNVNSRHVDSKPVQEVHISENESYSD